MVGEEHGLKHVHHLRDIGHAHAVSMTCERIDVERGNDRVALTILLLEETFFEPGVGASHAPHSSTTSAIFFSGSYLSMIAPCVANQLVHAQRFLSNLAYSSSPKPVAL